jgi:hypothetical protein
MASIVAGGSGSSRRGTGSRGSGSRGTGSRNPTSISRSNAIEMICLIIDYFIKYAIFFQILHFISGME